MISFAISFCLLVAADPTTSDLVKAYDSSIGIYNHVEFRARFREIYDGPSIMNGRVAREGTYFVRHDERRWKITFDGVARHPEGGRIVEVAEAFEKCVNDRGFIEAGRDRHENETTEKLEYVIAEFKGPSEARRFEFTDHFLTIFGYFPAIGSRSLTELLQSSKLEVHRDVDVSSGKLLWRLESVGQYGRVSIWFDPEFGMQVRRLTKTAAGDDLVDTVKVSDIPPISADLWRPDGQIIKFTTAIDVDRFASWGDTFYPSKFTVTVAEEYTSGHMIRRYETEIDNFRGSPEFADDAFEMKTIPEGFAVQVDDSPKIEYQWRDGRISKVVNRATERNLFSAVFRSTYSGLAYFVIFAVLLIGLLLVGTWVYRRAKFL
jgi:hypothetical protein